MHMSFIMVRISEYDLTMAGNWGKGFSRMKEMAPSDVFRSRVWDFATRRRSRVRVKNSDSSLEGVKGGVGGRNVWSMIFIWRTSDTHIVASAAISLASPGERGVVVKTTK